MGILLWTSRLEPANAYSNRQISNLCTPAHASPLFCAFAKTGAPHLGFSVRVFACSCVVCRTVSFRPAPGLVVLVAAFNIAWFFGAVLYKLLHRAYRLLACSNTGHKADHPPAYKHLFRGHASVDTAATSSTRHRVFSAISIHSVCSKHGLYWGLSFGGFFDGNRANSLHSGPLLRGTAVALRAFIPHGNPPFHRGRSLTSKQHRQGGTPVEARFCNLSAIYPHIV